MNLKAWIINPLSIAAIVFISFILKISSNQSYAQSSQEFYTVKKGEAFSEAIYKVFGSHLYGRIENLEKYIFLNPEITARQIFQYRAIFETEDFSSSWDYGNDPIWSSPELNRVSIEADHYLTTCKN